MELQHYLQIGLLGGSVSHKDAELLQLALRLLHSIGAKIPEKDQEWLSQNLTGLPDYLETKDGGAVMAAVLDCYREHITNTVKD